MKDESTWNVDFAKKMVGTVLCGTGAYSMVVGVVPYGTGGYIMVVGVMLCGTGAYCMVVNMAPCGWHGALWDRWVQHGCRHGTR